MPSLNHVCMWTEHGWVRITAEEAVQAGARGSVSAHSGRFMCELCGQYVTLAQGNKYVPYFKHSTYEESKNCPEHSLVPNYVPDYEACDYELPIRIRDISLNEFRFELGFLKVPEKVLQAALIKKVVIKLGPSGNAYTYLFERLNGECITYLDIGSTPALEYRVECDDALRPFWPERIRGISPKGSVFDARTGKRLSLDSDVEVGKTYYILGTRARLDPIEGMEIEEISRKKGGYTTWYIHRVCASALSEQAALFFLQLHCRLTITPSHLQPVWPMYRKSPYLLQHERDFMAFYIRGNRETRIKTFPKSLTRSYDCPNEQGRMIWVRCTERQQVISMGQSSILQYTYFWRDALDKETKNPEVVVLDLNGDTVPMGECEALPYRATLVIFAPYSGEIQIKRNGQVVSRRLLKACQRTELDGVTFGDNILILQGLDSVYQLCFARKNKERALDKEDAILKVLKSCRGRSIAIPHFVGGTASKLNQYPKIKQWLYSCVRAGRMPEDALRCYRQFLIDSL